MLMSLGLPNVNFNITRVQKLNPSLPNLTLPKLHRVSHLFSLVREIQSTGIEFWYFSSPVFHGVGHHRDSGELVALPTVEVPNVGSVNRKWDVPKTL